jgi:competence protein ComFC
MTLVSEEESCTRCRTRVFAFDRHIALFQYRDVVRELLYQYKFKGRRRIGSLFAALLSQLTLWQNDYSLIVPVPSSARSVKKIGFGHVEAMAKKLSRQTGIPFSCCLKRGKGKAQKSLNFEGRRANLQGLISFKNKKLPLSVNNIILLDDIFTTGATANECASVLKKNGAAAVTVLTVAMD